MLHMENMHHAVLTSHPFQTLHACSRHSMMYAATRQLPPLCRGGCCMWVALWLAGLAVHIWQSCSGCDMQPECGARCRAGGLSAPACITPP